jgi:uncharacterized protein (TIRG00374 family)
MKKHWWRWLLILILTVVLLYFFFRSTEWDEVLDYITDVDMVFLILSVVLAPVHLLTRAVRWKYLLQHEKEDVSLWNRFAANAVGFTVTLTFPGRLGELVKPLYLAQKEKIAKGFVLGTAVVERIFDIFTMCFLLGIFILAKPLYDSVFKIDDTMYSRLHFWGFVGVALASGLLIITLALYFFRSPTMKVVALILRPLPSRIKAKLMSLLEEFIQGLKFFRSLRGLVAYTFWSLMVWGGIIAYYWIFFMAYRVHITFFFMIPYTFMLMVGASIPTPGMVGGFDSFSKLGMTSFYKLDPNLAVAMTVVVHAVQVVLTCLLGYIILWKEGISLFQIRRIGEETEP